MASTIVNWNVNSDGGQQFEGTCTPPEGVLHPNYKNASILKAALRRHHISKALQLFKGGCIFDALHQKVCYFQMKASIIQARAFSAVRGRTCLPLSPAFSRANRTVCICQLIWNSTIVLTVEQLLKRMNYRIKWHLAATQLWLSVTCESIQHVWNAWSRCADVQNNNVMTVVLCTEVIECYILLFCVTGCRGAWVDACRLSMCNKHALCMQIYVCWYI